MRRRLAQATAAQLGAIVAACAAAEAVLWLLAFQWAPARAADAALQGAVKGLRTDWLFNATDAITHLADAKRLPFLGVALVIGVLVLRGPRLAGAAAIVVLGTNVTAQILQPLLSSSTVRGDSFERAQLDFPS